MSDKNKHSNRVKYVDVSSQIIGEILKMAASNAIPVDSRVLRVGYDPITNNFRLVIESKEFDEVPEGEMLPKHNDPVVSTDLLRGRKK